MLIIKKENADILSNRRVFEAEHSKPILKVAQPRKLPLVDIWGSERYHEGLFTRVCERFNEPMSRGQVEVHRSLSTEAASRFEDGYFDVVYIDTCHSYEETRDELNLYAAKVKEIGVIAGHDYSPGNWIKALRYGVIEAAHEFCVENDWEMVFLTIDPIESQSFAIRRVNRDG